MKTWKGKEVYPLTAAQKLHFYSQLYCPKKQLLNIGTSLVIGTELDFDILREAIRIAYDRCESMRLRFAEDEDGTVYQYIADKDDREIELWDFSGKSQAEADEDLKARTAIPFTMYDSPMNAIILLKFPDGMQGAYICAQHMTMDAQSIILFYRDVIEIYAHKAFEDMPFPAPMASYLKQLKIDLEYEAGSKAQERNRKFFREYIGSSEPIYTDFEGADKLIKYREQINDPSKRAYPNFTGSVDASILTHSLEEGPSQQLQDFCEKKRVSMVCMLLMALRTYLQKHNGIDDVSIVTNVARRAKLVEKRCGGTRIHCFPMRTIIGKDMTFMEALGVIRDRQNAFFLHADFDPVEFFGTRTKMYNIEGETYEPVSLTYQPMTMKQSNQGLEKLGHTTYRSNWYTNGVAAQSIYLTVTHRAQDNGLEFNWEYQTEATCPERLEYIYYYLCRIMFAGIRAPEKTVGEIIAEV